MAMDIEQCRIETERRFSEVSVKIQENTDAIKGLYKITEKHGRIIADIQNLSTSVSILANNMQSLLEEQRRQNKRIDELERKPAKRWESIVDKVLLCIVGGLVAYCLVRLGLG